MLKRVLSSALCVWLLTLCIKAQQQTNEASIIGIGRMKVVGSAGKPASIIFHTAGEETKCEWNPTGLTFKNSKSVQSPVSIKGVLNTESLRIGGHKDWCFWAIDTFDSGAQDWSVRQTSTCGASSDVFLGGHCKFGGGATTKRTFDNLPTHSAIQITARVHFFDKWLGEALVMKIDGKTSWSRQYKWCTEVLTAQCSKHGVDACGTNFPDKLSILLKVDRPHADKKVTLEFASTLAETKDPCEVSWGIDDVAISLR